MDPGRYQRHAFGEVRRTPGRHGYWAFHPASLPRRMALGAETAVLLGEAESALGRLDGISQSLPNPNLLVRPYLVREAVASTRIEGTRASIAEVYDADVSDAGLTPDMEEVVNSDLSKRNERKSQLETIFRDMEDRMQKKKTADIA